MKKAKNLVVVTMMTIALGLLFSTSIVYAKGDVSYKMKNGVLTVEGKGAMPKTMTFENNKKIKKVVVKKGITSISNDAFKNCTNLKTIKISGTVKTIGSAAFDNTRIKTLELPDSVVKIKKYAFGRCKKLRDVKIGKSVVSIGIGAFNSCNIEEIKIPNNVKTIGRMAFYNCKKLKKVEIGKSVESIGNIAFEKTSIKKVTIPNSVRTLGTNIFGSDNKIIVKMPGDFKTSSKVKNVISNAKKITFTSKLKLRNIQYLNTEKFVTYKKDAKYVSDNGNIYTKDKKTLVRVPSLARNVEVAEGCETICVSAFEYNLEYNFKLAFDKNIDSIVIPKSVVKIDDKKYITYKYPDKSMIKEFESAWKIKEIKCANSELDLGKLISKSL